MSAARTETGVDRYGLSLFWRCQHRRRPFDAISGQADRTRVQACGGALRAVCNGDPSRARACGVACLAARCESYPIESPQVSRALVGREQAAFRVRSLLTAGLDTTIHGIGHALHCFATWPEQWTLLRSEPALLRGAFEEVIRYTSPVQTFFRTTTRAVEVGGTTQAREKNNGFSGLFLCRNVSWRSDGPQSRTGCMSNWRVIEANSPQSSLARNQRGRKRLLARRQPFVRKGEGSGQRRSGTVRFTSRSRTRPNSSRGLGRSGTAERHPPTVVRDPFRSA